MVRNLLRAGHGVNVYNRTRARVEPLVQDGAGIAESPAHAVDGAEAVITMLADDAAVEGAVAKFRNAMPAGGLHIGMSTISVACSRKLAEDHAAHGQHYVAAPVFGRPDAAAAARLWIVAAGATDQIERCRSLFDTLGRGLSVVGSDPWLANVVKVSGNFLIAAALESLGEAFALVRKSGIGAAEFLEIANNALFKSPLYANYGAAVANEQFEPAGFKLQLGFKDLRLAQQAAEAAAVPMPLAGLLRDRFLAALARGEADLDWAAIARIAAVQAGL